MRGFFVVMLPLFRGLQPSRVSALSLQEDQGGGGGGGHL